MPRVRSGPHVDDSRWETHKDLLRRLYLVQDLNLEQIVKFMSDSHGLCANKWQYEERFREWRFRKNIKWYEWKVIDEIIAVKDAKGMASEVFLNGKRIPPHNVQRSIANARRKSWTQPAPLPPEIQIRARKVGSSSRVLTATGQRNHSSLPRPLLPRLEPWVIHDNIPSASRADLRYALSHPENIRNNLCTSSSTGKSLSATTVTTAVSQLIRVVLPDWATRDSLLFQNLPWFLFQAWLHPPTTEQTIFIDEMHGTLTPDLNIYSHTDGQQYDGMMVKEREISNEAITALERHFASRFHLDEVMPQFFQADASTGSQSARVVSRISDLVQAEKILFLIANNLVNRWSIVGILKEIFEKGQRHLLANLFRLKQSSTVRAFSCRIMEAISAAAKSSDGQWLLEELLSCGLDRSLLEGITGGRCLQLAIYKRCTKMALYLLRNGVQRNPKLGVENPFNKTPIGLAEFYCQHKVVQLLRELENQPKNETPRVSILAPYRESVTVRSLKKALYRQSTEHIIELTQALVASGVDIDCDRGKGLHSRELLLNMAYFVNRECYEILLPHSIFAQKFLTTSGLMSAASAGLKHLEQYLDSRSWHSTVKCQGSLQHMIQEATISGLEEEVCTLLSAKRIFEEIDASALFDWAVRYDRAKIIVALLKCDDASDVIFELLNNSKSSEVSGIFTLKVASFQRELINHALSSFQSGDKILERIFDFGWPFPWNDIFRTSLDQFFRRGIDRFDVAAMKTFDSLPAFQILLSRGFDLNTEMISGSSCCHQTFTPLYCAIECGQPELLEYMIDAGADVNYMGRKCGDPWGGDSEITLLELSLHKTDFSRRKKEDLKIFQLLLKHGANINQPHTRDEGISWNTALTTAILNPYANEQIFLALEAGADINQQGCGIKARTPLRAAVEGGRVDIVVELLRRGANINAPPAETYGRTALQAICSSESTSTELALLLIERGADINAPAGKYGGITALQGAAIAGNMKIAIILIDRDVDVNAPAAEEEGRMALDGAAEHGRIDMVKLLLNFQATCMEPGHTGYDSAISFAEENGHFVVADMLREHSCPVQSEVLDCDMSDFVIF